MSFAASMFFDAVWACLTRLCLDIEVWFAANTVNAFLAVPERDIQLTLDNVRSASHRPKYVQFELIIFDIAHDPVCRLVI